MASLHDNAYYRARIQSLRDYAELSAGKKKFYQNGLVPKSERANFDKYVDKHTVEYDNSPLTFTELMTYNTWYEQHPEKVAGTMVEGSSLYFPVLVKGTKNDVENMFKAALKEQEQNKKPTPKYKIGDRLDTANGLYSLMIHDAKYDDKEKCWKYLASMKNNNESLFFGGRQLWLTEKHIEVKLAKVSGRNHKPTKEQKPEDDELELLELEAEALEMELKLDGGLGRVSNKAKKRVLETVSVAKNGQHHQAVVSSTNGANILKGLDNLAEKLEKFNRGPVKTFLGDVAKTIGSERKGSKSEYATFETINGKVVTIRLADHNATVSTFDNHNEEDGISIVVTSNDNKGINNDGKAHVVEFYYNAIKLRRADGKPLAKIVRSIKQSLYSGEFKDTTGLAEKQEVNIQKR